MYRLTDVARRLDLGAGEEAAAKGTVRHETDPELPATIRI